LKAWIAAAVAAIAFLVFAAAASADTNSNIAGTIDPADGAEVSDPSIVISGTFEDSCGQDGDIDITVSSGAISDFEADCEDGTWTWSATWSGYGDGEQTVTVDFEHIFGCNPQTGVCQHIHTGEVEATYDVVFPTQQLCDGPFDNHGQYVSCVARGLESPPGKGQNGVKDAAKSNEGKPNP
jgi:hypothetical protein